MHPLRRLRRRAHSSQLHTMELRRQMRPSMRISGTMTPALVSHSERKNPCPMGKQSPEMGSE